jgi:hypothetical protein
MADAFAPRLEGGKGGVDPEQDDVAPPWRRRHAGHVDLGQPGVARQTSGLRGAAWGDRLLDEGIQLAVL